jgi:hypothetical protein
MPSKELIAANGSLSAAWDQTALRCSGSGGRAGESLLEKLKGDFVQGVLKDAETGVRRERSACERRE